MSLADDAIRVAALSIPTAADSKTSFSDEGERSDHWNEDTTKLLPSKIALVPNVPSRIAAVQP